MGIFNKIAHTIFPDSFCEGIVQVFRNRYSNASYSQEGEDIIIKRFFESKKKSGFYVDIGAHHPFRFSNTYIFYKLGWRGINVDALPGSSKEFVKRRRDDIFVETLVSDQDDEIIYYAFQEPALNTIDRELAEYRIQQGWKLERKFYLKSQTLAHIFDKYLPAGERIDFLSIDVEGADYSVLKSNNWEKYRPQMILVELLSSDIEKITEDKIYLLLKEKGYSLYAKTINTYFFTIQ